MDYRKLLAVGLSLILVSGVVLAADETMDRMGTQPATEMGKMGDMMGQQIQAHRIAQLLDKNVKTRDNKDVGELRDIVLDSSQKRIAFGVLDYKGQLHAIPWQAFQIQRKGDNAKEKDFTVTLNIDQAKLEAHKGFEKNQWPTMDQNWKRQAYQDFGMTEPTAMMDRSGAAGTTTPGMTDRPTAGAGTGTAATTPGMAGRSTTGMASGQMSRLSEIVGSKVRSQTGDIGNLEDVVAESRGHILFGLVSLEGKGVAEQARGQWAALPWEKLTVARAGEITANVDQNTLVAATFPEDKAPDFNDRAYISSTYQRYNVKPYWETYGYEGETRMDKNGMKQPGQTATPETDRFEKRQEKREEMKDTMKNGTLND